jgi:hypothetical protein
VTKFLLNNRAVSTVSGAVNQYILGIGGGKAVSGWFLVQ